MRKNKILSLLVVFIMICTLIPCMTSAEEAAEISSSTQMKYDTMVGLGIMSTDQDGNFLSETAVTRGDLAKVISNMYNTGDDAVIEWKEKFFKELDEEFETADTFSEGNELFTDVDDTSECYSAVKTVSELGIMTGYTDGSFGPDNQLTYDQAYKVIVSMLGYRARAMVYGGFPNGFMRMASELGLLEGLNKTSGEITNGDLAVLIYNALDVKVLDIVSMGKNIEYSSENSEIFLKRFLGMQKVTGRITDNGFSNLIGEQTVTHDYIAIGNLRIKMTDEVEYARDYFGRTVNAYVTDDNSGKYTLKYAATDDLDKVVTINAEDFISYQNGVITYKIGDDNKKTARLQTNAYVIYNGSGIATFNESTFKFQKGTIEIVTPYRGSSADLAIVNKYDSMYLDYVDYENKSIYSKDNKANSISSKSFNLDRDETYSLRIYDKNGSMLSISELAAGQVISVSEGKYSMTIRVTTDKLTDFIISETGNQGNDFYVSNGKDKYRVKSEYMDAAGKAKIKLGEAHILYLDVFGDIVYLENSAESATSFNIAVVIDSMQSPGLDSYAALKVMTLEGVAKEFTFAKKVKISDSNNIERTYTTAAELDGLFASYNSIIRYKLNKEGLIEYVEFPIKQQPFNNPDNRLTEITLSAGRDQYSENGTVRGWYYKPGQGFAGQVLVDRATAKVFVRPKEPSRSSYNSDDAYNNAYQDYLIQLNDEECYSVAEPNSYFSDDGKYIIAGYTTRADSRKADYIVYKKSGAGGSLSIETKTVAIFNRSYQGVDENGIACQFINFFVGTKEYKYPLSDKYIGVETFFAPGVKQNVELEKGDLFRYKLDAFGKVEQIQILVDENAVNPQGGQGNLAFTEGCWDSSNYSTGKTNPYTVGNVAGGGYSFDSKGNWWSESGNGRMRNALYWAVNTRNGNELCLTTQPLGYDGAEYVLDEDGVKFVTDYFIYANATFITIGEKGVTVKSAPCANIKTYEMTQNDCDRVFVMTRVGSINNLIVYTNYSK